jgi:acyl-CoA synthetase (AMP-forming)/AMP-acid ligase II
VRIVGRNKDMIIRGGENIYPRELEEFFFTHPAVADVQVIGIPCSRYGEEIVAWIKFHPGHSHRAGTASLVQGAHRALQDAALLQVRRGVSDDGDRQDPEIPDARDQYRGVAVNGHVEPCRVAEDHDPD